MSYSFYTTLQCHKTRTLALNRHEARKLLTKELDDRVNGKLSLDSIESMKIQEKCRKKKKRTALKYGKTEIEKSESEAIKRGS